MPRRWTLLAKATLILLALGCRRESSPGTVPSASAPPGTETLPSRLEVVSAADRLALDGSRKGGKAGTQLLVQAAELRRRLWRHDRREADALEAIELYRAIEQTQVAESCDAEVNRLLLEGEVRADPAATYRSLYSVTVRHRGGACHDRAVRALATLAAFKPLPHVLRELEQAGSGGKADKVAPVASVQSDEKGPVVVPTRLDPKRTTARVTSIERYPGEDAARIVVFMDAAQPMQSGFIPAADGDRGPRLFVDISNATYTGKASFDVGGLVERVRIGTQPNSTRVVLDLKSDVYRRIFYLPEPFRLVIDVSKQAPRAAAPEARGRRVVRRVVIDPGHGGHDPGAVGPGGLREKDVTLDIAHRAAPLVARELGVVTLLTRDTDAFVPLDERAARANAFGADIFVSIHCNASAGGGGNGVMTFVLDESRDAVASQIAAVENAASPGASTELARIMSRVADVSSVNQSLKFADLLQRSAFASLKPAYPDVKDGGVRRAGFYVLAGAHMPAVLFETSFISNSPGEARLNTGDYRQKLADAIVNAIRAYREGL